MHIFIYKLQLALLIAITVMLYKMLFWDTYQTFSYYCSENFKATSYLDLSYGLSKVQLNVCPESVSILMAVWKQYHFVIVTFSKDLQ